MPTPAISLKMKKFKRRFGITAPRVVVRGHLPWQWIALPVIIVLAFVATLISFAMQRQEVGVMAHELETLRQNVESQQSELDILRSTAGTRNNAVSIERATQQQLLTKIRGLERENSALKEDIRLFERLIPVVGEEAVVRIEGFRVSHDLGGRFRYRLVLAFQPGKQNPDFRGRLQLAINYAVAGKEQQVTLPDKRSVSSEYQIELKHFLRRDGFFELPAGAELKSVEARVLQGDTLRAKQLTQL
jgi:low affinity Fe/Cu permease